MNILLPLIVQLKIIKMEILLCIIFCFVMYFISMNSATSFKENEHDLGHTQASECPRK